MLLTWHWLIGEGDGDFVAADRVWQVLDGQSAVMVVNATDLWLGRPDNRQSYTALTGAACLYCKLLRLVDLAAL